jgi:hypothetical protein
MYNIYSFDPELIKLHGIDRTENFYTRKFNIVYGEKGYKFLLSIRKNIWLLKMLKISSGIFL